jgi:hypothetical protein
VDTLHPDGSGNGLVAPAGAAEPAGLELVVVAISGNMHTVSSCSPTASPTRARWPRRRSPGRAPGSYLERFEAGGRAKRLREVYDAVPDPVPA